MWWRVIPFWSQHPTPPARALASVVPPWPRRALLDAYGHVVYAEAH